MSIVRNGLTWSLWVAAVVGCFVGCGKGDVGVTVQGTVTYRGKPLDHGMVTFVSSGNSPVGGKIQPDGTYQCELPAGEYQVAVSVPPVVEKDWNPAEPIPDFKPTIPAKYSSPRSSGLKVVVGDSDGENHDFSLE